MRGKRPLLPAVLKLARPLQRGSLLRKQRFVDCGVGWMQGKYRPPLAASLYDLFLCFIRYFLLYCRFRPLYLTPYPSLRLNCPGFVWPYKGHAPTFEVQDQCNDLYAANDEALDGRVRVA
jgi:hypothetical protein